MENLSVRAFSEYFKHKGNVAPIAEKANRNFEQKLIKEGKPEQRQLYYYAIGHVFKQLDTKAIFEYEVNEESQESEPKAFLNIRSEIFTFEFAEELYKLIDSIRNINSHYVHDFSVINTTEISESIQNFLKESFELAVIQTLLQENKKDNENKKLANHKFITYEKYKEQPDKDQIFVNFLCDKFFPEISIHPKEWDKMDDERKERVNEAIKNRQEKRSEFKAQTKTQAINYILFIENNEPIEWKLYEEHKVFTIPIGTYLSFHGSLFLLSMFLYKGEANPLIGKIKGFKLNDDNKHRSKRNLFSFYSKKFAAQDINSEESHLVKFRDIVQYLNHFPSHWNKELELDSKNPEMEKVLMNKIIDKEIERCYYSTKEEKHKNTPRFKIYVRYQIWGKKYLGKAIEKLYIKQNFSDTELKKFHKEVFKTKKYKDLEVKVSITKNDKKREEFEEKLKKEDKKTNEDTLKLIDRIAKNQLHVQYGRNQDRFMEFAAWFLAENNYFGSEAKFKMYVHFYPKKQEEDLQAKREGVKKGTFDKKDYDKLKYHRGKLVDFFTYKEHNDKFPTWDTPFAIEDNCLKVKLKYEIKDKKTKKTTIKEKIVHIQRKAMIYFLEHALFNKVGKVENSYKGIFPAYFFAYERDFNKGLNILKNSQTITPEQKTEFKNLFPKRLLHKYSPAQNSKSDSKGLEDILIKAEEAEKRYALLLDKVKKEEESFKQNYPDEEVRLVDYFKKRNKGKQFKLAFVRKACHLMYFKDSYLKNVEKADAHHKRFHITKDEFNSYSKWMFAFGEVTTYKSFLEDLFTEKGFMENPEFKSLFRRSNSLEEFYTNTKQIFKNWLNDNNSKKDRDQSHKLENYTSATGSSSKHTKVFDNHNFLINIGHFIKFLKTTGVIEKETNKEGNEIFKYGATENIEYLISEYYYKKALPREEFKKHRKLFTKLRTTKLEDALLYEIAMRYLQSDEEVIKESKTPIEKILKAKIEYKLSQKKDKSKQDNNKSFLYTLKVPFNKIMQFAELNQQHKEQEKQYGESFLQKIKKYAQQINEFYRQNRKSTITFNEKDIITFEELHAINNFLIQDASKFTRIGMVLEKYYIFIGKLERKTKKDNDGTLKKDNRILYENIKELVNILKPYGTKKIPIRNKAFHFGIHSDLFVNILREIEKDFIKNEIKQENPNSFEELKTQFQDVCNVFLHSIYDNYKNTDRNIKIKDARNKYFKQVIKRNI